MFAGRHGSASLGRSEAMSTKLDARPGYLYPEIQCVLNMIPMNSWTSPPFMIGNALGFERKAGVIQLLRLVT